MKERLNTIRRKIDKVYDDRLSNFIDENVFQRMYRRLKKEQADAQEKTKLFERSADETTLDKEKIRELAETFMNAEEYGRELIVSLIDRIELTEDKQIIICFKFKELN